MKTVVAALLALVTLRACGFVGNPVMAGLESVRAHYIITVTDDFIVDAYLNGRIIPHSQRELLGEKFGATVERIDVNVHSGDWLVFNVVNDRMRWGGAYYFAVAGCLEKDDFGFVSELQTGNWSACDSLGDVDRFITERNYFIDHPAQEISRPWSDGIGLMHMFAGNSWNGTPIWGISRNTWIKLNVP
jgi:hypothetical protein